MMMMRDGLHFLKNNALSMSGAGKWLFPLVSLMALLVWFVSPFLRSSVVLELPSSSHSPRLPVPEPGQALNVLLSLTSKSHPRPHKDTLMLCNPILGLAIPWESNADERLAKQKKIQNHSKEEKSTIFRYSKEPFPGCDGIAGKSYPMMTDACVCCCLKEREESSID